MIRGVFLFSNVIYSNSTTSKRNSQCLTPVFIATDSCLYVGKVHQYRKLLYFLKQQITAELGRLYATINVYDQYKSKEVREIETNNI